MGIWRDIYGVQSEEFADGVIAGVTMYAVWKDGVQVVGVKEQPLQEAIEEINSDLRPQEQKDSS